jgi:thiamine biosynthesis lipoprotein
MSPSTFRHEAMATHFEIVIAGRDHEYARQAAAAAFRELDRLENLLSRFIESSDISRANLLPRGGSTTISDETLDCLLIAADVSMVTQRAFDPAYSSVRPDNLEPDVPPYTLDPATHTLTSRAEHLHLDLGAVGKGFALDQMANTIREWQITSACLNAGGSSALALESPPTPGERGWIVGLGEGRSHRQIPLLAASLSGSGTAVQGAHLIDPRTGQPARRTTRVWALAPTAAQADALSTAFFVMNETEVAALCAAHPQIGGALATADEGLAVYGALREALEGLL